MSKTLFNNYLAFSEIPTDVAAAIRDFSKVSSRSAYEIKNLSSKGQEYVDALIKISKYIRDGAGEKKIKSLIGRHLRDCESKVSTQIYSHNGLDLFTQSKNRIVFSKFISESNFYDRILDEIQSLLIKEIDAES